MKTLDLHQSRRHEVDSKILSFISQCIYEREVIATIIHGRSGGIVEEEMRKVLDRTPYVLKYEHEYGNVGATIIYLAY